MTYANISTPVDGDEGNRGQWKRFLFPKRYPKPAPIIEEIPNEKVHDLFSQILQISDHRWGNYYAAKDPLRFCIQPAELDDIIKGSLDCATNAYTATKAQYGSISPRELCDAWGINIIVDWSTQSPHNAYLATFTEKPPTVRIYAAMADRIQSYIEKKELYKLPGLADYRAKNNMDDSAQQLICDTMIAHELFHFIEMKNSDIFTKRKLIENVRIGPYSKRSSLICAGEMAATLFSKLLSGGTIHPGILEMIVLCMSSPGYAVQHMERLVCIEQK